MSDLFDQVRILAVMYLASYDRDPTKPPMSYRVLASEEYLKFMEDVGRLSPMATDLHISEYIAGDNYLLYLTKKGVETIKALFRKFLAFIKKNYPVTLSTWINNLELNKNTVHTLIRDSYFYIEKEPLMQEAFKHYLNEIETIENVDTFKVDIYDSSRLIEDIYLNLDDIYRLFEYKFNFKLFLPPVASQTILNKSVRGKEINFTDFIATIGSIIDSINSKETDKLLNSSTQIDGSINKIEFLLNKEKINYDAKTIETLRALHRLRSKTFPIHDAGPEIINELQRLNIDFPIRDYKDAVAKILQSLNSSLLEMKLWFT